MLNKVKDDEDLQALNRVNKEPETDNIKPVSIVNFFKYASNYERFLMFLGMLGGCGTGMAMPLFSVVFGEVLNEFSQLAPPGDNSFYQREAKQPAVLFTYLMAYTFFVATAQMGMFTITAERQTLRIRQKYLAAVLRQEISWFDERQSGELASKVAENTVVIKEAMGDKLGNLFQFMTMFFGGFIVGFYYNWKLTLVLLSMLPALGIGGYLFTKAAAELTGKGLGAYTKAGSIVQEALVNIRTVTAFNGQGQVLGSYDAHLASAEKDGIKKSLGQGIGMGFTMFAMFCCYALAFGYGSILIAQDRNDYFEQYPFDTISAECREIFDNLQGAFSERDFCGSADMFLVAAGATGISCECGCGHPDAECLPGGDVTLVFFSVLMASFALGQATPSITALKNGQAAAAKIYQVINRKPAIDGSSGVGEKPELDGRIKFQNVTFSYPTRSEITVLNQLNLIIPAGKSTALVGGSGCGKSTVMALIQRFYDPNSGKVIFNESYDLRNLDIAYVRNQFGLVAQEPVLFATTISENIALGAKLGVTATDAEIVKAAKAANAYDFIMGFPDKFNTLVGGKGRQLSGGQKQRIAIARALLRDPTFLLLDEATSALDNESEKVVQTALDKLLEERKRTTIVIAHRLSTVRNCDNIVVLGEGRVLEQGTHTDLMKLEKGVYSMLVHAADKTQEQNDSVSVSELLSVSRENSSVARAKSSTHAASTKVTDSGKPTKNENTHSVKFSRLMKFVADESWLLIVSLIAAAVNGAIFPVFSLYLGDIMTALFEPETDVLREDSRMFAWIFVGIACIAFFANFLQAWGFGVISEKMTHRVRYALFDSLLKKQISFFDKEENSVGALASRLSTDAALVKANIADRLSLTVQNFVTVTVGFTLAFINGWQLTLILLAVFPVMSFAAGMEIVAAGAAARDDDKYLQPASSVLQESISGIRTVTAFNARERIVDIYREFLRIPMKIGTKKGIIIGLGYGISQAILFGLYGLIFYVGAILIDNDVFDFESMLKVFWLIIFTAFGVGQTFAMAPDVAKGSFAISNVFQIIDEPTSIDPSGIDGSKKVDNYGATLEKVDFTYPSRPDARILHSLSINIAPGKTVALVGSSGSGKSTVIALLERFYDPNKGRVVIANSSNLKSINISWWRHQISLVEQEPNLFASSVSDNIRFGSPEASQDDIVLAAKAANAHDFICNFPSGYDTLVGEQGTQLSGGQKQRICIARAILRKPSLLLLDEATSALDNKSEKIVQQALDEYVKSSQMTTVVIAHRLTTIQNADNIMVFAHGKLLEEGTHTKLMERRGGYYKLWEAQSEH